MMSKAELVLEARQRVQGKKAMQPCVGDSTHERVRPFLRWAGSKRQLVSKLAQYWTPQDRRYVEPFAGSACLFFRLCPDNALLGDINGHLIATYQQVKDRADEVSACLSRLERGRAKYMELRAADSERLAPPEQAARFIYLNRFCFNGLYRTNRAGGFNVPYGGEKAGAVPSAALLAECSKLLQKAELIPGDFAKVLARVDRGDFVYMDPPFSTTTRRIFNEYAPSVFGAGDIQRLRNWMEDLDARSIPFLISYAECNEAEFLRRGFHAETVTVKRNIAGFAANRGHSSELLISNRRPIA